MYFLLKNYIPTLYFSFTHIHIHAHFPCFFFLPSSFPSSLGRLGSTLQVHASGPRSAQKRRPACESFVVPFIQPDKSSTTACAGQGRKFSQPGYPIYRVGTIFPSSEDGFDPSTYLFANFVDTDDNLRSNLMTINTIGSSWIVLPNKSKR